MILDKIARNYSTRARRRRGEMFVDLLKPTAQDKILDFGGSTGAHLASVIPFRENVHICDISTGALATAEKKYGFTGVLLNDTGPLPFPDDYFDIVFCSSVIEHVTGSKDSLRAIQSSQEFINAALARQAEFAQEIRRISKRYFVQTPYKYFPIESHTWLPFFFVFLPRPQQIRTIDFMNSWWPKRTSPDWNLLTKMQMQQLFPGAEIVAEKSFGLTKSLIAISS